VGGGLHTGSQFRAGSVDVYKTNDPAKVVAHEEVGNGDLFKFRLPSGDYALAGTLSGLGESCEGDARVAAGSTTRADLRCPGR
jgi:hypothetical protein